MITSSVPRFERQCGSGTNIIKIREESRLQVCLRHQLQGKRLIDWAVAEIHTPEYPVRHLCKACAIELAIIDERDDLRFSSRSLRQIIIDYVVENGNIDVNEIKMISDMNHATVVATIRQMLQEDLLEPDIEILVNKRRSA
jgi:hypothetical protein